MRRLIAHSSEDGAWAALERGELTHDDFVRALDAEAREAGLTIETREIMKLMGNGIGPRPEVIAAIHRIREQGLRTAALTNNWPSTDGRERTPPGLQALSVFDVIVESAVEGMRKPDPRIYELTCARLGVAPSEAVFLDDIGSNLKPARALGMATIKVTDTAEALRELSIVLGFEVSV